MPRVRLKAANGKYIVAQAGGRRPLAATADSDATGFEVRDMNLGGLRGGDRVRLTIGAGPFVTAERGGGGDVVANRLAAAAWETFTVIALGAGGGQVGHNAKVALRAHGGQFLRLGPRGHVIATGPSVGTAEALTLEFVDRASADPAVGGRFVLGRKQLDVVGVHAVLLRTGQVLFFAYKDHQEARNVNLGTWQLWDPRTGPVTKKAHRFNRNWFCAGHCILADGRVLVAGGQSNTTSVPGRGADHDIHVLEPDSESWTRYADMPAARYYPTCLTLADGSAFIAGGARSRRPNRPNDDFELFLPDHNKLAPPRRFRPPGTDFMARGEYPLIQLLPDGSPSGVLFVFSGNEARLFDLQAGAFRAGSFPTSERGSRTYPHQGACALLPLQGSDPGSVRILVVGGRDGARAGSPELATRGAEIFEFNRQDPAMSRWSTPAGGGRTTFRRFMSDVVLLPDETVLVVNGASRGAADSSHDPVLEAEIFDPRTETFRVAGTLNRPRMYHSVALLLPDGRVAISGNSFTFNPDNEVEDRTIDLYHPPYLFRGPRPTISAAPGRIDYGDDVVVNTPDAALIESVGLIHPGAVTHTNNMGQRHVKLDIRSRTSDALNVSAPAHPTIAPPGHYLLVLLTQDRVPSEGRFVQVGHPPPGPGP